MLGHVVLACVVPQMMLFPFLLHAFWSAPRIMQAQLQRPKHLLSLTENGNEIDRGLPNSAACTPSSSLPSRYSAGHQVLQARPCDLSTPQRLRSARERLLTELRSSPLFIRHRPWISPSQADASQCTTSDAEALSNEERVKLRSSAPSPVFSPLLRTPGRALHVGNNAQAMHPLRGVCSSPNTVNSSSGAPHTPSSSKTMSISPSPTGKHSSSPRRKKRTNENYTHLQHGSERKQESPSMSSTPLHLPPAWPSMGPKPSSHSLLPCKPPASSPLALGGDRASAATPLLPKPRLLEDAISTCAGRATTLRGELSSCGGSPCASSLAHLGSAPSSSLTRAMGDGHKPTLPPKKPHLLDITEGKKKRPPNQALSNMSNTFVH